MLGRFALASFATLVSGTALAVPVKTDFVFLIDATTSMRGEIAGVRNGFSSFVSGLNSADVDGRFAVVVYGGAPELVVDFTSDGAAAQAGLNEIVIGPKAGFQNNHNLNPEAGLEAIRMALGGAGQNELANNNIAGDGLLDFRSDARINLILATDEDSDTPFHEANRFGNQAATDFNDRSPRVGPGDAEWDDWQAEIDATAEAVIGNQAYLNMLINRRDFPTRAQYGDHAADVSDPDLLNFDPDATLANLLADVRTANSLQAQVLGSDLDLVARTFDVAGANDPDFVDNFFSAKLQEVVEDPGPITDVPEPGPLGLLGIGLLGLAVLKRSDGAAAAG